VLRPLAVVIVALLVAMIDVELIGLMHFWDLRISSVTVVQLVMAVGMCGYMHVCMYTCICVYACMHICMSVCMHVCIHVCVYICMHICMSVCMHVCIHVYVCMHVCIYVCMYVCMYVYMYMCVCMYAYMYVCMHVCIYVCLYACMYVCMHVYVYIYICVYTALRPFAFHTNIFYLTPSTYAGLVVDYVSHVIHYYLAQPFSLTPKERLTNCLVEIGPAVLLGCSTTFLGTMPLAFADSVIFRTFFKMYVCMYMWMSVCMYACACMYVCMYVYSTPPLCLLH
jgi:hypothetical protein